MRQTNDKLVQNNADIKGKEKIVLAFRLFDSTSSTALQDKELFDDLKTKQLSF